MTDPPRHPARRSLPTLPDVQPSGAAAPSMRGPLPTSNWVVPGLLLCGAEPDGPAALRLVMLGVRVFVCLQSELPSDRPLPYRAHAERGSSSADDEPLEFVHEPIPDGTTFREEALRELVERVAAAVRVGRPVYVHCRGGHGRTGVVVACVLGELYPALTAAEVLGRVQAYHDARANPCGTLHPRGHKNDYVERLRWTQQGGIRTDYVANLGESLFARISSPLTAAQRRQAEARLARRPANCVRSVREACACVGGIS